MGERRQVAIFFADLCGFTALSTRLDAEDLRRLAEGFLNADHAIIAQYGGTVDKHNGDVVMALFRAPIATETSDRSAATAQSLQDQWRTQRPCKIPSATRSIALGAIATPSQRAKRC